MQYATIYSSQDRAEISIIKHLLEENDYDFRILDEATSGVIAGAGVIGMRVQVPEEDADEAKDLLRENGVLGELERSRVVRKEPSEIPKWIFFVLAAVILIAVSFIIVWFMNPQ